MAFFGLTALGRQNAFSAAARISRNLQIFEDEDFSRAWEKVNGGRQHCTIDKIDEMLHALFHGPVPENDKSHIDDAFLLNTGLQETSSTISYGHWMKVMSSMRDQAEEEEKSYFGKDKPSVEFNSSEIYQDAMMRNTKFDKSLQTKQTHALTAVQEYGWEQPPGGLRPAVKGRQGSDITKFAAELVKNGIYY